MNQFLFHTKQATLLDNSSSTFKRIDNIEISVFETSDGETKSIRCQIHNYLIVLTKKIIFCKTSPNHYYYKTSDDKYPFAVEVNENFEDFEYVMSNCCSVYTGEEIAAGKHKDDKLDIDALSDNIKSGGKRVGSCIADLGQYLGQKIGNFGGYISEKITPNEKPAEVSSGVKNGLKAGVVGMKTAADFTKTLVEAGVSFGAKLGGQIVENLPESETMNKIKKHDQFENAKTIGWAGIKAGAQVFNGIIEGVGYVGAGIGNGIQQVVQKKYGDEAGKAVEQTNVMIGEAVEINYAVRNAIINELKQSQIKIKQEKLNE